MTTVNVQFLISNKAYTVDQAFPNVQSSKYKQKYKNNANADVDLHLRYLFIYFSFLYFSAAACCGSFNNLCNYE